MRALSATLVLVLLLTGAVIAAYAQATVSFDPDSVTKLTTDAATFEISVGIDNAALAGGIATFSVDVPGVLDFDDTVTGATIAAVASGADMGALFFATSDQPGRIDISGLVSAAATAPFDICTIAFTVAGTVGSGDVSFDDVNLKDSQLHVIPVAITGTCHVVVNRAYSISGTVTNAGEPFPGVEVTAKWQSVPPPPPFDDSTASGQIVKPISSAGVAGSATTGPDGTYTIDALAAAIYTVTPSLAEYAFDPASSDVTVNETHGDAAGIDFAGAIVGDFDGDGDLDIDDAAIFIAAWIGAHQAEPAFDASCDIAPYTGQVPAIVCEPNGVIDMGDATLFIELWIYHHQ